jgi:putative hydrolase of the HAD superfamily
MFLIFDLDDTLYDEKTYVNSGLCAVAKYGEVKFGWNAADSLKYMQEHLKFQGRGKIFDDWLQNKGRYSRTNVEACIRKYRNHPPEIELYSYTKTVLDKYYGVLPLYLVTDGHKEAQKNKIKALNLDKYFKRIFVTHRFGIRNSKPSLHCFEIIRKTEKCEWSQLIYVGDNPMKDFVSLNRVGAKTIRVLTGSHANLVANLEFDAQLSLPDLSYLQAFLDNEKEITY